MKLIICLHCDARIPVRNDESCSACRMHYSEPTEEQCNELDRFVLTPIGAITMTTRWMAGEGYSAHDVAHCVEKPWNYAREWLLAEQESTSTEAPS